MEEKLYIKNFSNEQIRILLPSFQSYTDNDKYDENAFVKYIDDSVSWIGVCDDNDKIFSLAVIQNNFEDDLSECLILEIQSIIRGYGKELLLYLFSQNKHDIVYFTLGDNIDDGLVQYLSQFGLKEIEIDGLSVDGVNKVLYRIIHQLPPNKLKSFIKRVKSDYTYI